MAPKTTRLTPLLHELEAAMAAQGAPFSTYARPGISDEQIDALLAPTGLTAPTELREWWRWHHGISIDGVPYTEPVAGCEIGPGRWGLMTISESIDDQAMSLEDDPAIDGGPGWVPTWLPLAFAQPDHRRLVARLAESTADEVCVGMWWVFDVPPAEPVARSLAEVVETWLRVLGERHVTWEGTYWKTGSYRPEIPPYAHL